MKSYKLTDGGFVDTKTSESNSNLMIFVIEGDVFCFNKSDCATIANALLEGIKELQNND